MTTDWYAACLTEVSAFLDQFTETDEATVRVDDDLIAALVGVLSGAVVSHAAAQHALAAVETLRLLETVPSPPA